MNPDLYSEEFRNFKYLKSSPEQVQHYRRAFDIVNNIQDWAITNDPHFVWPNRVEFLEQLIDLEHDSVYIVYAGYRVSHNAFEHTTVYEIKNPKIYQGSVINPTEGKKISVEDIPDIEKSFGENCHLCSSTGLCLSLDRLPVIPGQFGQALYTALFYNKHTAEMYASAFNNSVPGPASI